MQRSLLDQNEPLLHAESFLSDQQCRSLLAAAIVPVRQNAPLQLSCRCKAQEPSLIDSWRADSESLSMAPARNYPMCENAALLHQATRGLLRIGVEAIGGVFHRAALMAQPLVFLVAA